MTAKSGQQLVIIEDNQQEAALDFRNCSSAGASVVMGGPRYLLSSTATGEWRAS